MPLSYDLDIEVEEIDMLVGVGAARVYIEELIVDVEFMEVEVAEDIAAGVEYPVDAVIETEGLMIADRAHDDAVEVAVVGLSEEVEGVLVVEVTVEVKVEDTIFLTVVLLSLANPVEEVELVDGSGLTTT